MTRIAIGILAFVLCFNFSFAQADVDTDGDEEYVAEFSEEITSCKEFTNEVYKCDLKLGSKEGDSEGEGGMSLSGHVDMMADIKEGYQMKLGIWKMLEIAEEFMYSAQGDICANLDSKEAPWYPLILSLNVSSCPIITKQYPVKDMTINLDFAKDILCHEFCGEYRIEMSILAEDETPVSCHILYVVIHEK